MHKFIVVGGGTSGHINPAITIADALKEFYEDKGGCEIIFTGRNEGLEGELVPKAGYDLKNITAKPFPMKPSIKMIKAYKALQTGKKQCRELIGKFEPDAVIGTGGYVCAPLLLEAERLGVPVILHEANAFPGRANKMIGNRADLVLTGFENLDSKQGKLGPGFYGLGAVPSLGKTTFACQLADQLSEAGEHVRTADKNKNC